MNNFSNIVVIGAGIVGASIAFHLARRDAKVTLIDAGEPGKGSAIQPATAVSFAWMNARDKNPRHYHLFNRRSVDMWARFVERRAFHKVRHGAANCGGLLQMTAREKL